MKTSAIDAIRSLEAATPDVEVRITRRMEIGQVVQQGDVYLHRVADDHPRGERIEGRRLAVGTSTGARHDVTAGTLYAGKAFPRTMKKDTLQALLGPLVHAPEGTTVTHPEHPHHQVPPGTYQVTYQLDMVTRERVRD